MIGNIFFYGIVSVQSDSGKRKIVDVWDTLLLKFPVLLVIKEKYIIFWKEDRGVLET